MANSYKSNGHLFPKKLELCSEYADCCSTEQKCDRPFKVARIEKEQLKQLKTFILSVFPVSYDNDFYKQILHWPISLIVTDRTTKIIGAFCAKFEETDENKKLYISVFGVNVFWRRRGIGTAMFAIAKRFCEQNRDVKSIYLHVQKDNEDARAFYEKFGFVVVDEVADFYRRTHCPTALIMEKDVR
ncbi:N-alpha-acetyltransferase 50 [Aphelenchoides besseyi]|nr:N-alpha-acetyltransferase 50 [Aphelenchoides besseyi]